MAESEEELKNLLMRVKEESSKNGLKLNIKNTKMMASGPITVEDMEAVRDYFLGSLITPSLRDGSFKRAPWLDLNCQVGSYGRRHE